MRNWKDDVDEVDWCMSEKRFIETNDGIYDNQEKRLYKISAYEFFECEIDEVVNLLNDYDRFEKWVESLEISKSVELDELLASINYIFVRYNNTVVDDSDTVELKVSINDATGFSMELKRRFDV